MKPYHNYCRTFSSFFSINKETTTENVKNDFLDVSNQFIILLGPTFENQNKIFGRKVVQSQNKKNTIIS